MSAMDPQALLTDALAIARVTIDPGTALVGLIDAVERAITLLPPIDAAALDPADRAAADVDAAAGEDSKFGPVK